LKKGKGREIADFIFFLVVVAGLIYITPLIIKSKIASENKAENETEQANITVENSTIVENQTDNIYESESIKLENKVEEENETQEQENATESNGLRLFTPSEIRNEPPNILLINKNSRPYMIKSAESMWPTILDNDTIVVTDNFNEVKIGDIIWFVNRHKDILPDYDMIFHRVVDVFDGGYLTKGDNNDCVDPFIVRKEDVRFKVIGKLK